MKNPFKRNPKPDNTDQEAPRPSLKMRVVAIPNRMVEEGRLLRITDDGVETVERAGVVFDRLNTKLSIEYDPYVCYDGRRYWTVKFMPEYYYRGRSFGENGVKAVKEIGLMFPNDATPWTSDVEVQADGRISWRTTGCPEAASIAEVVTEANRQVAEIIRDYSRTEAILKVAKGSK